MSKNEQRKDLNNKEPTSEKQLKVAYVTKKLPATIIPTSAFETFNQSGREVWLHLKTRLSMIAMQFDDVSGRDSRKWVTKCRRLLLVFQHTTEKAYCVLFMTTSLSSRAVSQSGTG
jgi:hypothetical protein